MSATNSENLDPIVQRWVEQIRQAKESNKPLVIQGSGSKAFYGHTTAGEVLSLTDYQGIIDYEPSELVVTVKCGTPLAELENVLSKEHQFLPFEPPHFGPNATVGGCIAAGLAGPRRAQVGGVRDFVLGVKLIDGHGQWMTFGGQVMKNVAGYDVSRLVTGSLGTLGILSEVSIKVLPKLPKELTLKQPMAQKDALQKLNEWAAQPIPMSASLWHDGQLYVRLSGASSALDIAQEIITGTVVEHDEAVHLWQQVREQEHSWFTAAMKKMADHPHHQLWRLSVPSTSGPILDQCDQLIEWGGALRWCVTDLSPDVIRAEAEKVGGTASIFRSQGNDLVEGLFKFHPLSPVVLQLQKKLKEKFDPAGILNPGKIYPGEL